MKAHTFCTTLLWLAASGLAWAAPQFDRVYGSHMVLPQGKSVPISGTTDASGEIIVRFDGQTVPATRTGNKWKAELKPMKANKTGQKLTVTQGKDTVELDDVLIGEVWLASGQSNMLWRLNQTPEGKNAIQKADNAQIRILHNEPQVHTNPAAYKDADRAKLTKDQFYTGQWAVNSPQSAPRMSAVAYHFANVLQKELDVPVGIIHSSLGGSEMAAWIPDSILKKKPFYSSCRGNKWLESPLISPWARGRAKQNIAQTLSSGEPMHPYKPGFLYSSGIEWIAPLPVNGIIWYQGETDAEAQDMKQNATLLRDLITSWRQAFGNAELPFVMVQLPRINDKSAVRAYWPEFRAVQDGIAAAMPNVASVTTIDLGSTNSNVHPPSKTEVGTRLAHTAAARFYGKDLPYSGPSMEQKAAAGASLTIRMKHADGMKTTDGQAPRGFEIAGKDKKFHPATAVIEGNTVKLTAPQVQNPVHARYAWATFLEPNLVNKDNLPAVPFSTALGQPK